MCRPRTSVPSVYRVLFDLNSGSHGPFKPIHSDGTAFSIYVVDVLKRSLLFGGQGKRSEMNLTFSNAAASESAVVTPAIALIKGAFADGWMCGVFKCMKEAFGNLRSEKPRIRKTILQ